MNKLSHKFEYGFCRYCGLGYLNKNDPCPCEDIVFKSNTHQWEFIILSFFGREYKCKICGIDGYRMNDSYIVKITDSKKFYTCNEILIIKTNE